MNKNNKQSDYVPALRYHWLTSLYDPILRWTMRESAFKSRLIKQVRVEPGESVLDLGCGTGTLTLLMKQSYPKAQVIGLDADSKVLHIAKEKVKKNGLNIDFIQGMSYALPFPDHSFDRVVSSLMFHHLSLEDKLRTLVEIYRVLKPQGELHIADWGKAQNSIMRFAFLSIQLLDGFGTTADNVKGLLPRLMEQAEFEEIQETTRFSTVYGTLSLYKAIRVNGVIMESRPDYSGRSL